MTSKTSGGFMAADNAAARPERVLCFYCRPDPDAGIVFRRAKHTNPGDESMVCECGERTCACYGLQVRAGIRRDRSQP